MWPRECGALSGNFCASKTILIDEFTDALPCVFRHGQKIVGHRRGVCRRGCEPNLYGLLALNSKLHLYSYCESWGRIVTPGGSGPTRNKDIALRRLILIAYHLQDYQLSG